MLPIATILVTILSITEGARILGIVPTPSYSHQVVFHPIWKELARRGHEVVLFTTDPIRDASLPNLREVDWSGAYDIWRRVATEVIKKSKNPISYIAALHELISEVSTFEIEHPEMQALINNKTEHFDLVMAEILVPTMAVFKYRFNCPLIGISSLEARAAVHKAVGNPVHYVLYPESMLPFSGELNFFQRLISVLFSNFFEYHAKFSYVPKENAKVEKYFGKEYPNLEAMRDAVDMIFVNTNPIYHHVRPLTPATIKLGGGIHIKEKKELPQDLKKYLDGATEGFIYMSLGSNVKSRDLEKKEIYLEAFSKLPYKVLWKFEAEELPGKPANVQIMKWVPQQDVLRHPNIKAFITQGGLQSLEEALLSHVPVVVMPFFADQESNANKAVARGLGITVNYKTTTSDEFKAALMEVASNPKYKNKVKELATLIMDEPMTALERAIWWTEYVIRNKGAQHLKGPGVNMPLYQYYYIDVISFVVLLVLVLLYSVYFVLKTIKKLVSKILCRKKIKVQ